jgi:hypothetical protein
MTFSDKKKTCTFDTECYANYWSIGFQCIETLETRVFEKVNDGELDVRGIARVFANWCVVGFNSGNYDMPMVALAMAGASNGELKRASDGIILADIRPWQFYELHKVSLPDYIDHIDLMDVSPGSPTNNGRTKFGPSLKVYAGRLHSATMQELPIPPDEVLSDKQIVQIRGYHKNDLNVTRDLYCELREQIDLRRSMSDEYGIDLRSKSDPQVAEAVIRSEVQKELGRRVYRPDVTPSVFHYDAPDWVTFETEQMQQVLQGIKDTPFAVDHSGKVELPQYLADQLVVIGDGAYNMGIGGLHSTESHVTHRSDDEYVILDRDVTSYYPSLILMLMMFPKQLTKIFLTIYRRIFERRVSAKLKKLFTISETLKIVLNGTFGKFGDKFSVLFSPKLMIQTTITGQLAIFMLIERLIRRGFQVISVNTDGIVTKVQRSRRFEFEAIIKEWEWDTTLNTEETEYTVLASRDVNCYIAIQPDGKVKMKGNVAPSGPGQKGAAGLKKNPNLDICSDAVVEFLKNKTPLLDTIMKCRDIGKFVSIRRVNGGAVKDGALIGKVVRFYYAAGVEGTLKYKANGNDVPKTEGAQPLMTLPDEFPIDIDYERYLREATGILEDFGLQAHDPAFEGRTGVVLARLGKQVTYHHVELPEGVAVCGRRPPSVREGWVETTLGPDDVRVCSKCKKEVL